MVLPPIIQAREHNEILRSAAILLCLECVLAVYRMQPDIHMYQGWIIFLIRLIFYECGHCGKNSITLNLYFHVCTHTEGYSHDCNMNTAQPLDKSEYIYLVLNGLTDVPSFFYPSNASNVASSDSFDNKRDVVWSGGSNPPPFV